MTDNKITKLTTADTEAVAREMASQLDAIYHWQGTADERTYPLFKADDDNNPEGFGLYAGLWIERQEYEGQTIWTATLQHTEYIDTGCGECGQGGGEWQDLVFGDPNEVYDEGEPADHPLNKPNTYELAINKQGKFEFVDEEITIELLAESLNIYQDI